ADMVIAAQEGAVDIVIAVHVPRTSADFVPLLLAASRCGLPFVLLSTDLPDKKLELERNAMAMRLLQPRLVVSTGPAAASLPNLGRAMCISVHDLELAKEALEPTFSELPPGAAPAAWCYMFTGGTQRTKVVTVTHAMLAHERAAYSCVWRPRAGRTAVVLAHTSVYWGASALGQLSIALAYGGTVVWTEAAEVSELRRCIAEEAVNVLGVVPDHLDLLAPTLPAEELPGIEVVFTWGERLPLRVADRWRTHPTAVIRELLIATEYWLSLWADPLADGVLHPVSGTDLLVLTDLGQDAEVGELGEMCIAGPMVMAGYRPQGDVSLDAITSDSCIFHVTEDGRRFYRTRDLVRRVRGGVVYKGRADMMAKSAGKWVDMLAVEDSLSRLPGVLATKILPDKAQEHFHAFLALDAASASGAAATMDAVRALLPPRVQLWQVPEFPRHPVTRKVDTSKLLRLCAGPPPSWPLEGDPRPEAGPPMLAERLALNTKRRHLYTLAALGVALAVADGEELASQLVLLSSWLAGLAIASQGGDELQQLDRQVPLTATWLVASVLLKPFSWATLLRSFGSLAVLTYGWLALIYADAERSTSRVARAVNCVVDEMPLWKFGSFVLFSLAQHLPGLCGGLASAVLAAGTSVGLFIAVSRARLLSWPVVFWLVGPGHQLHMDCRGWLTLDDWRRHVRNKL
ncbi:unnamed protein product, partial [Polarella glacialis]